MERITFSAGQYIFRQGDTSERAYIIESGYVEFLRENDEHSVKLTTSGPGDIFGEMGLIDEKPRSASARAVGTIVLTSIYQEEFVETLFESPERAMKFLGVFFERLRQLTSRVNQNELDSIQCLSSNTNSKEHRVTFFPANRIEYPNIPKEGIVILDFPFRVGRQSTRSERFSVNVNDLFIDDREPYNISKNHLSIERDGDDYKLIDRGSFHGTIVNGKILGGKRNEGQCILEKSKNKIILGKKDSPYHFFVEIE